MYNISQVHNLYAYTPPRSSLVLGQIYGESPCCDWNWNPRMEGKKNFKPFDSSRRELRGLTGCLLRFRIHHLYTAGQNPRSAWSRHPNRFLKDQADIWGFGDEVSDAGRKVFDWLLGAKLMWARERGELKITLFGKHLRTQTLLVQHGNIDREGIAKLFELSNPEAKMRFFSSGRARCVLPA